MFSFQPQTSTEHPIKVVKSDFIDVDKTSTCSCLTHKPTQHRAVCFRTNPFKHNNINNLINKWDTKTNSRIYRVRNIAWREYLGNPTLLFMEACSKSEYVKAKIDKAGNHRLFKTVNRLFTSGQFYQLSKILWIPCLKIWMTFMYKGFGTSGVS